MKSTRATLYLKNKGIPFTLIPYEHKEKGAVFAAKATGFPLEKTIKTLVLDLENNSCVLVLMPGDRELSLKQIAGACAVKRVRMADVKTAERLTGYLVGGISPFGTRKSMQTFMEKSLAQHDKVVINAGQRGLMLQISPEDILRALDCRVFENEDMDKNAEE